MTQYNWSTFSNEEIARLCVNGGIVAGFDTDFNRELVEEAARRIDRAAQLECERDKAIAEFSVLKQYALEMQADLDAARADIVRYQDERVTLLGRIETLAVENEQLQSEINYLRSTDHAADLAFEHAQKIGARYVIDETPLGQSLDGQGDEVEP